MVLIDDYSHFVMVKLFKNASEAASNLKVFMVLIKTEHDCKTMCIRVDYGEEFLSRDFEDYCRRKRIEIQYTPQQNGTSERMNRTLLNKRT